MQRSPDLCSRAVVGTLYHLAALIFLVASCAGPGGGPPTNGPPVFQSVGAQTIAEGASLSFAVRATDPEADAVTIALSPSSFAAQHSASFDGATFRWTPPI